MTIRIIDNKTNTVIYKCQYQGVLHGQYNGEFMLPRIGELIALPTFEEPKKKYNNKVVVIVNIIHRYDDYYQMEGKCFYGENNHKCWFYLREDYCVDVMCEVCEENKTTNQYE